MTETDEKEKRRESVSFCWACDFFVKRQHVGGCGSSSGGKRGSS
jgi:hypothetical protein